MKRVKLSIIVVLQFACLISAYSLIKNRRSWMKEVRSAAVQHMGAEDMEAPQYPEIGLAANWPRPWILTTGDSGLPPMVLSLMLLFAFSVSLWRDMGTKFRAYWLGFFVVLIAFHLGMIFQQNVFVTSMHQGRPNNDHTVFTSKHGILMPDTRAGFDPSNPEWRLDATVRDPNIIPLLLIGAFLTAWLPIANLCETYKPRKLNLS